MLYDLNDDSYLNELGCIVFVNNYWGMLHWRRYGRWSQQTWWLISTNEPMRERMLRSVVWHQVLDTRTSQILSYRPSMGRYFKHQIISTSLIGCWLSRNILINRILWWADLMLILLKCKLAGHAGFVNGHWSLNIFRWKRKGPSFCTVPFKQPFYIVCVDVWDWCNVKCTGRKSTASSQTYPAASSTAFV